MIIDNNLLQRACACTSTVNWWWFSYHCSPSPSTSCQLPVWHLAQTGSWLRPVRVVLPPRPEWWAWQRFLVFVAAHPPLPLSHLFPDALVRLLCTCPALYHQSPTQYTHNTHTHTYTVSQQSLPLYSHVINTCKLCESFPNNNTKLKLQNALYVTYSRNSVSSKVK